MLKYDLVTAVMHGYTVKPDNVMQELGYEAVKIAQGTDSVFYEVANVTRPLHSFLEESEILDGRFDPRETAGIKKIDRVATGACNAFPSPQEASGPGMVGNDLCELKSPAIDPEKKRESLQRTKAKRSSNFRK